MYVNDAIGYKLTPEQPLYVSPNAFGTADAIGFRRNLLRIFDYKSGEVTAKMDQVLIYAAFFCLEYHIDPESIDNELRIYQNNEVIINSAPPEMIQEVMNHTLACDERIEILKNGE